MRLCPQCRGTGHAPYPPGFVQPPTGVPHCLTCKGAGMVKDSLAERIVPQPIVRLVHG